MTQREGLQLSLFREKPELERPVRRGADGSMRPVLGEGELWGEMDPGEVRACAWTERERDAWAPPEDLRVSEWAERYRMLSSRSAAPGPWKNTPYYTVEVMDAFIDPIVERITIMASVQSSKTESIYNTLGFAIDQDPAPALVMMPTLTTLRRVNKRIEGMIRDCPRLSKHLTGNQDDLTRQEIRLDNMTIYFATAGSSADLRNVEARYVYMDETDDYEGGVSDQGSPIEMGEARATTFWNRKINHTCTPTTVDGYIAIEYEKSDKARYWVPCPYCRGYQVLSFWQVKHAGETVGQWPKDRRDPDYILAYRVGRYECEHCGAEIDDRDKRWMLRYGTWVPEGHRIEKDGTVEIPRPRSIHRGFWWSALYSPWRTFSDVAAKYFASKDDLEKYKTFVNLWLAEPWKEITRQREDSELLGLLTERPQLVVPSGTLALTAGIDNQKYGKWIVIRAWRRIEQSIESHLIRHGFVETWAELEKWLFEDVYTIEDSGIALQVWRAGIDIGGGETDGEDSDETMTEQVYDWIRASGQGIVYGVKGASRQIEGGRKMKLSIIDKMPGKRGRPIPGGIKIWILDTNRIKDAIWSRIDTGKFFLNADIDEVYFRHMTAEAKQKDRRGRVSWQVQGSRANHSLDAEVYAAAMADPECDGGVMVLKPPSAQLQRPRPKVVYKSRMMA